MASPAAARLLEEAADDAQRAIFLIQKLTSSKEEMKESLPRGTESMPAAELHFCSGLAFTFVKKGGVGLSLETGHGFVIRKIQEPPPPAKGRGASHQPSWSWSAPLFINVLAGGVGLTLGYSEIENVVVLDTPEAVQSFTHGQTTLDTDITGAAGSSLATHLPATAANLSNLNLSDKTFSFSVARGAIVDVSLTGQRYGVDERMNGGLYGGASPQAVLDGGVEGPAAFQELYSAIDTVLERYHATIHEAVAAEPAGAAPDAPSGGQAPAGEEIAAQPDEQPDL